MQLIPAKMTIYMSPSKIATKFPYGNDNNFMKELNFQIIGNLFEKKILISLIILSPGFFAATIRAFFLSLKPNDIEYMTFVKRIIAT